MSTLTILAMDPNFVDAAATIAADLRLRAGDAIYVALAQQLNIPLVSWDKEQLQKASSLIPVYTPDSYPFTTTNNPNEI